MIKSIRVRLSQGKQYIPDLRSAHPKGFRGLPQIRPTACEPSCTECQTVCPTSAISLNPVQIDLGKCVFCNECTIACPSKKIAFTEGFKMATDTREGLIVSESAEPLRVKTSKMIKSLFGRSLKLRSVSAGGCNGCELELNALGNVNFDIGRFGIEFVASPRHADGLVLTGPITQNMSRSLESAYAGMPDPKFVIAVGACAISGGLYQESASLNRDFLERFRPSLYIPGCPPHPLTFVNGILDLIGRF